MSIEDQNAGVQSEESDSGSAVVQLGKTKRQKKSLPGKVGDTSADQAGGDGGHLSADKVNGGVRNDPTSDILAVSRVGGSVSGTVDHLQAVFQFRCKICNLSKSHSPIYEELHRKVIVEHMKLSSAQEFVNSRLKDSPGFQPLNMANLSVHFSRHAPVKARAAYEISRQESSRSAELLPNTSEVVQMIEARVGTEVDDFKDMAALRTKLQEKLQLVEATIVQEDPSTGNKGVNRLSLQVYTEVIKEVRACINDLNKMRQSERLMSSIVKALVDRMTFNVIPQLMDEYKLVTEAMHDKGVDPIIVKMVDERLRLRLAQIIGETARNAVVDVSREFKI
jgi:hypothetical protein